MLRSLINNNLFRITNRSNPYHRLGLSPGASEQQIKNAYYKLAKQYHPDIKPEFAQTFKEINQAYTTLKDPAKRSQYENPSYDRDNSSNSNPQGYYQNYQNYQRPYSRYSNSSYRQQYYRDPNSFKRQQMRKMRREFAKNIYWHPYYSRGNFYSPLQALFGIGLVFSIFIMMGSMMFSLYQYDLIRRGSIRYGSIRDEEEEEEEYQ